MPFFLIPTSAAEYLALSLDSIIGKNRVIFSEKNRDGKRYFPDGEVYVKISKAHLLKSKRVVVLHSGAPKPNEGLIELENILQILNNSEARSVEIFFTYFPYGTQDTVFEKGEANMAESLIKKLTFYYKVSKIYIIDAHFKGQPWVKKYPVENITAIPLLVERAKKEFGSDICILSPDKGGKRRTKIGGMNKKRINSFNVEMEGENIGLKDKTVGAIDDLIKTGGTLVKFHEIAKKSQAKNLVALITHGVMPSGISRIKNIYDKVYLTNTIYSKEANVDVTNLILEAIL